MNSEGLIIHQQRYLTDLENCIIGACILETEALKEAAAIIRTPDAFYWDENKILWRAMVQMLNDGHPVDMITTTAAVRKQPSPSGEEWAYIIATKTQTVSSATHIRAWCIKLVELYADRFVSYAAGDLSEHSDPLRRAEQLNEIVQSALQLRSVDDWSDMSQVASELSARRELIRNGHTFGVKCGIDKLDLITGGFEEGLIVIAARPSMGKTAFAASIAVNMAKAGTPIGIISLEMPNVQLGARIASIVTGVEFWRIFRAKHTTERQALDVDQSLADIAMLPIFISDTPAVSGLDIRIKAERAVAKRGVRALFIDYLQLVELSGSGRQTRWELVGELSRSLKRLAHELKIPIFALAQLNRDSEKTGTNTSRPGKLSQLRESGNIEQDIDMGIIIDRPFKRGEERDENGMTREREAYAIIDKFRNGETGSVRMDFCPERMYFSNYHGVDDARVQFTPPPPQPDEFNEIEIPF